MGKANPFNHFFAVSLITSIHLISSQSVATIYEISDQNFLWSLFFCDVFSTIAQTLIFLKDIAKLCTYCSSSYTEILA